MYWGLVPWMIFIVPLIFVLASNYRSDASSAGHKFAARELVLSSIPLVVLIVIFELIPSQSRDFFLIGMQTVISVIFLAKSIHVLKRKYQIRSLRILMDLGYSKASFGLVLFGFLLTYFAVSTLVGDSLNSLLTLKTAARSGFHLSVGSLSLLLGFSKLLITERGIYAPTKSAEWKSIQEYRWEGTNEFKLILKLDKRFPLNSMYVPVEPSKKDAVQTLLSRYTTCLPNDHLRTRANAAQQPLQPTPNASKTGED